MRTWTFTDVCGNTSSVSQTITVLDNAAPVPPAPPADLFLQSAADIPPPVDLTAIDNADGPITVSPTAQITPGACQNDFTMVRTWTFVDTAGNFSAVSQTITVLDDTPPVPPAPPADLTLQSVDDIPPAVDLTATDNVDGPITVSPSTQIIAGSSPNDFTLVATWTFTDTCGNTSSVSQTIVVINTPPDCFAAGASVTSLWPPNHQMKPVNIVGVTEPDGDPITITIDSIFQDEPIDGLEDGDTAPDGQGIGTSTASLRAERVGDANGRVYYVDFTASDNNGGTCSSTVFVGVPISRGSDTGPVGEGALYDSTQP